MKRANAIRANPELTRGDLFADEIERFLDYKLRKHLFTPASADTRRYVLGKFFAWCGKTTPAAVTPADVSGFYNASLDGLAVSTTNSYLMILSSFFEWAVSVARIVRLNPCTGIEMAADDGQWMRDFCTPAQRDQLIANCEREDVLWWFDLNLQCRRRQQWRALQSLQGAHRRETVDFLCPREHVPVFH